MSFSMCVYSRVFDQLPTLASPLVTDTVTELKENPPEITTLTFASGWYICKACANAGAMVLSLFSSLLSGDKARPRFITSGHEIQG